MSGVRPAPAWLVEAVTAPAVEPSAPAGRPAVDAVESDGSYGHRYAHATVAQVCAELACAVEGTRNDTAFRVACRLVELANAPWSGLGLVDAEHAYYPAGLACGLGGWELGQVWRHAVARIGDGAATLPPSYLGGDVAPFVTPPVGGTTGDPFTDPGQVRAGGDPFEAAVAREVWTLQVRAEARRRLDVAAVEAVRAAAGALEPLEWRELMARDHSLVAWLPGKLAERGQQVAVVGEGKCGKSLFMLELAWRAAAGKDFLTYTGCGPLRVVYADRENAQRDVAQRLAALGAHPDELAGLAYYSFPVLPYLDESGAELLALVERHNADIVVLDTVSRFVMGGENDSDTWLSLYRNVHAHLKARGCAGFRLDHFGKDTERGSRGSSAKSQDIDHVWEMAVLSETVDGPRSMAKVRFSRTHTRSGVGDPVFDVDRVGVKDDRGELWLPGRTAHTLAVELARVWSGEGVREIAERLDAAGVPRYWGRDRIRAEGLKLGVRQSNEMWSHVARYRKEQHAGQLRHGDGDRDDTEQDVLSDP